MRTFLRLLRQYLGYFFYPNPGGASYTSASMLTLIALCCVLVALSIAIRLWRTRLQNPVTKKLSRSWSSAAFWFGVVGLLLVVCRVEGIQFLAMRSFWGVWLLAALVYLFFQWKIYRARHYEILPKVTVTDPRSRYLPGKARR